MNNKMLKKIRDAMISDGFTEYDVWGNVTPESGAEWNTEFARRKDQYEAGK